MPDAKTPDELYAEGRAAMPAWNEPDPDGARHALGLDRLRAAAEAGHIDAMKDLADGFDPDREAEWCVALARRGDVGPLTSALVNTDHPPSVGLGVLAAARAGEAWAMLAVGRVYAMGMCDGKTGEPLATRDGAFGWIPGVPDPDAEGAAWAARAQATGWPPALLWTASRRRRSDPQAAYALVEQALRGPDLLVPRDRAFAGRLLAELADAVDAPAEERLAVRARLAEGGDADAMAWMGDAHRTGKGTKRDLAAARAWYTRAADAGSVDGCRELAKMLEKGRGGPVDAAGAQARYEAAAELGGDPYSRDRLATHYGLTWYARRRGE